MSCFDDGDTRSTSEVGRRAVYDRAYTHPCDVIPTLYIFILSLDLLVQYCNHINYPGICHSQEHAHIQGPIRAYNINNIQIVCFQWRNQRGRRPPPPPVQGPKIKKTAIFRSKYGLKCVIWGLTFHLEHNECQLWCVYIFATIGAPRLSILGSTWVLRMSTC